MSKPVTFLDFISDPSTSFAPTDVLQGTGLVARAYSKFVLDPRDIQGGVTDLLAAASLFGLGTSVKGGLKDATAADYLEASGLVARAYSRLVLTPADQLGAFQDILAALKTLGLVVSS